MSRIEGFINVELGSCLGEVSETLTRVEARIHKLGRSAQADEADKKALSNALVRIQKVRNGLHGG
jgi:hypothetical protein